MIRVDPAMAVGQVLERYLALLEVVEVIPLDNALLLALVPPISVARYLDA